VKIICTVKSCVKRTSRNDKKYYFIVAEDESGEFKSMFMEREHIPFLQKGKSLPDKRFNCHNLGAQIKHNCFCARHKCT
jgi:hypothetical protein